MRYTLLLCQSHAIVRVALRIKSPVRHVDHLSAPTTDSEGVNEHHDLSPTVQSSREQEVVLPEPPGAVDTEVVLREHGKTKGGEDGRVNTDAEVSEGPAHDGSDDLVGADLGPLLVDEPEGKGDGETNKDGQRDDTVATAWSVERITEGTPGNSLAVEALDLLTRPDVGTLDIKKNFPMGVDDDLHDDVVEETTNDGTTALDGESDARGKLGVLTHLEVTDETTSLVEGVESVKVEVHVGLGASWKDGGTNHLHHRTDGWDETGDGVYSDGEGQEDGGENQAKDETPPGQIRATGVNGSHSHSEGTEEHGSVPPHRDFGVDLHLGQVRVVGLTSAILLDDFNDVLAVPDNDMHDGGADSQVGADLPEDLGGREEREPLLLQLGAVDTEVFVKDSELVVISTIFVKERLRHEGEVLGVPSVLVVRKRHGENANHNTEVLRELSGNWGEQGTERSTTRANVVPVEA